MKIQFITASNRRQQDTIAHIGISPLKSGYLCSGNSAKQPLNAMIMIRYKKYKSNTNGVTKGRWYGRSVTELLEFDEFIKHMANHHCVFGESTIRGVLIEMQVCLRELLLEGKAVRLDELGIFRIGLETYGADTAKEFTADNIGAVRLNLYLGKRFRAADLYKDAKFREAGKYDPDDGETITTHNDDGTPSGGGSSDGGSSSVDPDAVGPDKDGNISLE